LCTLAFAHLGAGNLDRGLSLAREAIALSPGRDLIFEIEASLLLARAIRELAGVQIEAAQVDEIEAALARASEGVEETGACIFIGGIHREAAELAALLGDTGVAEREFNRSRDAYLARGALALAREVEERLAHA
jgi:hypothetical protein